MSTAQLLVLGVVLLIRLAIRSGSVKRMVSPTSSQRFKAWLTLIPALVFTPGLGYVFKLTKLKYR